MQQCEDSWDPQSFELKITQKTVKYESRRADAQKPMKQNHEDTSTQKQNNEFLAMFYQELLIDNMRINENNELREWFIVN